MSKLSEAKFLGSIGSVLLLLAGASLARAYGETLLVVGANILLIVGAILVLVAVKHISDALASPSIFTTMLIGVVLVLVAFVMGSGVMTGSVLETYLYSVFLLRFWLASVWIPLLLSAVFVAKSYWSMATRLGVGLFMVAGLLYLMGAALMIIEVGYVPIFAALVLNFVSFFSLSDKRPAVPSAQRRLPDSRAAARPGLPAVNRRPMVQRTRIRTPGTV